LRLNNARGALGVLLHDDEAQPPTRPERGGSIELEAGRLVLVVPARNATGGGAKRIGRGSA
jgi:hypothetical protein